MTYSMGLSNQLSFVAGMTSSISDYRFSHSVEGDIQRLSEYFPAESFDAIFSIESLRHLPSFESIYVQLHELLKPGGKVRSVSPFIILCLMSGQYVQLAIYEWCWTDILNPRNIEHQQLTEVIESSTMIGRRQPFQRSMECATRSLSQAHFHVLECLDRAGNYIVTPKNTIEWYAPLEVAIGDSRTRWSIAGQPSRAFGGLSKEAATALVYAGQHKVTYIIT